MLFTHHLPSGDRRVIGDRCGDRLRTTCHHALNPDEQGRLWLQVIEESAKNFCVYPPCPLPSFSLRAYTYARMNIIMCLSFQPFSPPHPFFKKNVPSLGYVSAVYLFLSKKLQKNSGIYLEYIRKASTFAPAFQERTALRNWHDDKA